MRLAPTTKVYGVVGSPVGAFDVAGDSQCRVRADRLRRRLSAAAGNEGYESFKAFMESFLPSRRWIFRACRSRIPHKENALKYLQEKNAGIDPLAIKIGAVNTIRLIAKGARRLRSGRDICEAPELRGLNTDYAPSSTASPRGSEYRAKDLAESESR